MGKPCLCFLRTSFHYGPISFMYFSVTQHLVQSGESFGGLGKNHQAGYGPVNAVYDTAEYIAWFGIFVFYVRLYHVYERSVARFVALDDFSGAFVNDYYVVVFVDGCHSGVIKQKDTVTWIGDGVGVVAGAGFAPTTFGL